MDQENLREGGKDEVSCSENARLGCKAGLLQGSGVESPSQTPKADG
jgi:hypothetical protein